MDTIYYTLNVRRVKVAGGPDRVWLVPEASTAPEGAARSAGDGDTRVRRGELVSLEMGKARMERKNAWKALVEAAWG